ncbi:unnamed protein product [Lupinus luteus]|uniref:Uncharacterized protein n=1 Tax=Lupinus luteus TaxID=3873 RepID=A0AAV1XQ81_LUPLU
MSTPLQIAPVSYVQPTRPTEVVVDDQNLKRIRKLESIFKSAVNNAIAAVKFPPPSMENNTAEEVLQDVPITIGEPNEHDSNVVIPCSLTPKNPKLKSSSVVDTQNITFELPQPCLVDHIDMDKLPSFDKENNIFVAPRRKLSYRERLNGWSVELRQRDKNDKREKGSDMTTNEQRKKRLCVPTSSSVDERPVQEITRNVVEKPHKGDNPNIAKNVIELNSQRSMPKQVVHMYQSYSQQLAHAWQKQMIANYHQSLFYDIPNKAQAPTTERTCMATSNDDMGEKGKGKMALDEF